MKIMIYINYWRWKKDYKSEGEDDIDCESFCSSESVKETQKPSGEVAG